MNQYQSYIYLSKYARYLDQEKRRETWEESVTRYINFMYLQAKKLETMSSVQLHELYTLLGASCDE